MAVERDTPPGVDLFEWQRRVWDLLASGGPMTDGDLSARASMPAERIREILDFLCRRGLAVASGAPAGGPALYTAARHPLHPAADMETGLRLRRMEETLRRVERALGEMGSLVEGEGPALLRQQEEILGEMVRIHADHRRGLLGKKEAEETLLRARRALEELDGRPHRRKGWGR